MNHIYVNVLEYQPFTMEREYTELCQHVLNFVCVRNVKLRKYISHTFIISQGGFTLKERRYFKFKVFCRSRNS